MSLLRVLICLVLGTPWLAFAQFGQPDMGSSPTLPSRQKELRDLTGDRPIWRVERPLPSLNADQMEERLAKLRTEGVDQMMARNKLLEAIKQAKRDCPVCMTVLEADVGSLGAMPGTFRRCKGVTAGCPSGRPFINSSTGVCTSVAEIKALP